jgi:pimeloyl-ACP methyl ester carboxylesterase
VVLSLSLGLALCGLPYVLPVPGGELNDPAGYAPAGGAMRLVAGTHTYVVDQGPPAGPAVVLIHGFGGSTFTWRHTVPALTAAGYRVIALDLRGFGLSDKAFEVDYSHAAQADFVVAALDELRVDQAILVGHSLGGSVSLHLAERHPGRVRGLVLVAAAARWGEAVDGRVFGLSADLGRAAAVWPVQWWARFGLRLYFSPQRLAEVQRSAYVVTDVVTPEVERAYGQIVELRDWDAALLGVVRDSGRNTLAGDPSAITAPAHLIWGEGDPWIPVERGRALAAAMPGSRLSILPGLGHLPMEEDPAAFNTALLAAFSDLR